MHYRLSDNAFDFFADDRGGVATVLTSGSEPVDGRYALSLFLGATC
jgi:hypothetical protein